jgi:hypothetical protein
MIINLFLIDNTTLTNKKYKYVYSCSQMLYEDYLDILVWIFLLNIHRISIECYKLDVTTSGHL